MSKTNHRIIIDLFSGAGGFSLGAHLAGFNVNYAIDNDIDLTYALKTNFPNIQIFNEDLSTLPPSKLLELVGLGKYELSGIIGGPPCQGFSYIGKREPDDPRNILVNKFFNFVSYTQPSFFVLENVLGLLSHPFNKVLDEGLSLIDSTYEVLPPLILNASDFGAATSRSRVFILGYRTQQVDKIKTEEFTEHPKYSMASVYDAIHDLPSIISASREDDGEYWAFFERKPESDYARRARSLPQNGLSTPIINSYLNKGKISGFQPTRHTRNVLERFSMVKPGGRDEISRSKRLSWQDLCPSLRAGTGRDRGSYQSLRPIHPSEDRVITVREAARLQGFPDWFQFHPTQWHSFRMIGNSVSPYVSEAILSVLSTKTE